MSKADVIKEASDVAAGLSGLLKLDSSKDFQRIAAALDRIVATPPPTTDTAWRAVTSIARGCLKTIVRRYSLQRAQKRRLLRALTWSVIYTTLYAPQQRKVCIEALLRCCQQFLPDKMLAFQVWDRTNHIILYLDIPDLEQLESVLVEAQAKPWMRRMIGARLKWLSANPHFANPLAPAAPTTRTPSPSSNSPLDSTEYNTTLAAWLKDLTWHDRQGAEGWLGERGLKLIGDRTLFGLDPVLNEVALFLGEHYDYLRRFHKQINESFASPDKQIIIENLTNEAEYLHCMDFSKVLKRHRLIKILPVLRNDALTISPTMNEHRAFFHGLWFERFLYLKLRYLLDVWGHGYSALLNYNVRLKDGTEVNLDIFAVVGNQPFFIECKSGGIHKDLDKHRRLKRSLGLSPNQVLCVKLNARPKLAQQLSMGFGLTVVDQQTVFDVIQAVLDS